MSSPARTLTAKSFFSPRGLLAQWHTNYEHRPGQLEMAKAVEAALEDKRTSSSRRARARARRWPTWSRRFFRVSASLFPPARRTSRSSSSSKTFRFSSSICRPTAGLLHERPQQLRVPAEDLRRRTEPVLTGLEEVADFQIIREWEKTTETGDRAEIREASRTQFRLGEDRRAARYVHRAEVPAVRALLHHADAPARARERHHHRQPPSVFRRPRAEGRGFTAGSARVLTR